KNGIAFFGFGYYVENQDKLQEVSVDFGDGAVEHSIDTIAEDGDYADSTRPLLNYLNVNNAKKNTQVIDFAKSVLNNKKKFRDEKVIATISDEEVNENLSIIESLK